MSSSSTRDTAGRRAQAEPVAALLAVALVGAALAVHAGILGGVLPGQSDRDLGDATVERVWADLRTDGVYHPGTLDAGSVEDGSLPAGRAVSVEVTVLTDEGWERDRARTWHPDGRVTGSAPPARARVTRRPIPVRTRRGTVATGRLVVAVWEP